MDSVGLDVYVLAGVLGIDEEELDDREPLEPTSDVGEWFGRMLDGIGEQLHLREPPEARAIEERLSAARAAIGLRARSPEAPTGHRVLTLDFRAA